MSNLATIENVLLTGDLAKLTPAQKLEYHTKVCELVGVNPLTKPFDYLTLNGKLVLYANKNCAEQLRKVHGISIVSCDHKEVRDMLIVTVKARNNEGREDMATAAINIGNLKGDNLANAIMKAETKAKRRVTLSICSLGMLDETEVEGIAGARPEPMNVTPAKAPTMIEPSPKIGGGTHENGASETTHDSSAVVEEVVRYKVPYDAPDVRSAVKAKGFRWNGTDKVWEGYGIVEEAEEYRIPTQPQEEDNIPW